MSIFFSDQFSRDDIDVNENSVEDAGEDTKLGVIVYIPGTKSVLEKNTVEEALSYTLQANSLSNVTNLTLGLVSTSNVSNFHRDSVLRIQLTDTPTNEVRFDEKMSINSELKETYSNQIDISLNFGA